MSDSNSDPSIAPQRSATNPNGQRSSMANTTQVFEPKEMKFTPNIKIDPTSNMGSNQFEKQ